jgi:hypothetical protein
VAISAKAAERPRWVTRPTATFSGVGTGSSWILKIVEMSISGATAGRFHVCDSVVALVV